MSHAVSVSLHAKAGALPEANFISHSSKSATGFLSLDAFGTDVPSLFVPSETPDAIAYLDALIRAACDLRNHFVEWAKTHEIALAA